LDTALEDAPMHRSFFFFYYSGVAALISHLPSLLMSLL
jgi:hypothetical protein